MAEEDGIVYDWVTIFVINYKSGHLFSGLKTSLSIQLKYQYQLVGMQMLYSKMQVGDG